MSWHCSQELAAAFLKAGCLDIESYVQWKKIRTAERSCFDGKSIKKSKLSPYGTISTHSMGNLGMASLMSSLLASPVKDSALLASGKANKTPAISGQKHSGSSQKSSPPVSSSKMFPELENTFQELSRILPLWGTTQNGAFCPLKKPEHLTSEKGGGLWPTPRASNPSSRINSKGGKILQQEVRLAESQRINWPTPRATEWKGVGPLGSKSHKHRYLRGYLDATVQERQSQTGKLNPDWVEWLMGWPIGWTSLDPLDTELFLWWKSTFGSTQYWDIDPSDFVDHPRFMTPRLIDAQKHRNHRLKCCGNGQVPHQVRLACAQFKK